MINNNRFLITILSILSVLCLFNNNVALSKRVVKGSSPSEEPFSMDTAFQLLMYSYSAYCIPEQLKSWTCPYCVFNNSVTSLSVTELVHDNDTDTFGFIGISDDKKNIVLSFRGTNMESLDNWITNLNFAKTEPYPAFPGALVHSGFNKAYRSIRNLVHAGFNSTLEICPTCTGVIITGHSLGGALGILAALDIYESSLTTLPLVLYTYGSPRVGDVAFAQYFESTIIQNYWRVVNDHDLVPHLPALDWNFYHIATEVWFNNKTNPSQHIICNPTGEDPHCSDSLKIALNIPEHLAYFNINKDLC